MPAPRDAGWWMGNSMLQQHSYLHRPLQHSQQHSSYPWWWWWSSLDFPNASECNQLVSSSLLVFPLPPPSLRMSITSFRYLSYTQTIAGAYDCFMQICAQVFSCFLTLVLWIFLKPLVLVIFTKTSELVHFKIINKGWKSCFQFLQVVMCNKITMRLQRIFISKMKKNLWSCSWLYRSE